MARVTLELRRNKDRTVTVRYGRFVASFAAEPWMSPPEILERARWELITLGVDVEAHPPTKLEDESR